MVEVVRTVLAKEGQRMSKRVNAVEVQDSQEAEIEQSYLELAMVGRAEDSSGPRRSLPTEQAVPESFPNVEVSELVR